MIVNSQEIEHCNFYHDFINQKKPALIKNTFNSNKVKQLISNREKEIKPLYSRGSVPFLYTYFDDSIIRDYVFDLPIIKHLVCNDKILFRRQMRLWQHDKGNMSYFHYDQRSTDLLNICISGSKEWLFLPPETSLKCWPFYNIALPFQRQQKSKAISIIMEPGDLVYIPRNWFHQVKTLQDNTSNINVIFNDLADPIMENREKELASIKQLFIPNYIYGDNIDVLNDAIAQVPLLITIRRILIETAPISVLFFIYTAFSLM